MTRTASFITGSIVVASALALSACGKGAAPEAAASKAPQQIEIGRENVVEVQSQPITVGPLVSGELKAEREATVRAEIGGSVLQVFPQEGQSVAAGALLARIEGQPVHDAYASAQSALRSAEQTSEWAQKEAARIENLVKGGALAERDAEVARNAATQAKAAADDARSRVASMRKSLDDLTVKAPIAGVVSKRHVNAGDVVSPGGELYTIIDPSSMRLEASVPSEQIARHPGRRHGHLPGPRLSERAVRGAHRARQPDRRSVDAPGADLRDHPQQAAPAGGRPVRRGPHRARIEDGPGRAADGGQRERQRALGAEGAGRQGAARRRHRRPARRADGAPRDHARRRRRRPAAGRRGAGHDARHAAAGPGPGRRRRTERTGAPACPFPISPSNGRS